MFVVLTMEANPTSSKNTPGTDSLGPDAGVRSIGAFLDTVIQKCRRGLTFTPIATKTPNTTNGTISSWGMILRGIKGKKRGATHHYPSDEGLVGRELIRSVRAVIRSRHMVGKDE